MANSNLLPIESFIFFICCLLCFFIPIPLFIDGIDGGLVLQNTSFPVINSFPIPVGLIAFSLLFLLFYMNSLIFNDKYKLLIANKKNRLVLFLITLLFFTWSFFIANNSFLRVVQLVLPFILLLLVAFPTSKKRNRLLAYSYLISLYIFISTHLISIYIDNGSFLGITEYEYSMYFSYGIYQAFVSFPGVLALAFALVIFLIFIEHGFLIRVFLFSMFFLILLSLGMAGRRISLFETSLTISILVLYLLLRIISRKGKILTNHFQSFLLLSILFSIFIPYFIKTAIFIRASASADAGTFDSGRIDIYNRAIDLLASDYYYLIFGYGGQSGFHNYFLDIVYSMGLFPFITAIMFFILYFKTGVFSLSKMKKLSFYLILSLLGCLGLQSMLNASITQPLYLTNFIIILLIAVFYTDFNENSNIEIKNETNSSRHG